MICYSQPAQLLFLLGSSGTSSLDTSLEHWNSGLVVSVLSSRTPNIKTGRMNITSLTDILTLIWNLLILGSPTSLSVLAGWSSGILGIMDRKHNSREALDCHLQELTHQDCWCGAMVCWWCWSVLAELSPSVGLTSSPVDRWHWGGTTPDPSNLIPDGTTLVLRRRLNFEWFYCGKEMMK